MREDEKPIRHASDELDGERAVARAVSRSRRRYRVAADHVAARARAIVRMSVMADVQRGQNDNSTLPVDGKGAADLAKRHAIALGGIDAVPDRADLESQLVGGDVAGRGVICAIAVVVHDVDLINGCERPGCVPGLSSFVSVKMARPD